MKTKAQRRSAILNAVMVVAILVIAVAGVITVGKVRGWFGKEEEIVTADGQTVELLSTAGKVGSTNIYRSGMAYGLKDGVKLRTGDEVETLNLSRMDLLCGDNRISLDENSRVAIGYDEKGTPELTLLSGGLYAEVDTPIRLTVNGECAEIEKGVISAGAPYGSGSVSVLGGEMKLGDRLLAQGEIAEILGEEHGGTTVHPLALTSLGAFELGKIRTADSSRELCFTAADVQELAEQREAEQRLALEAKLLEGEEEARIQALREAAEAAGARGETVAEMDYGDDTVDLRSYCTIEIRCDTILDNMDRLREGKDAYVPANGIILAGAKLSFNEGETAFDVLKRACSLAGIHLEYAWTPGYNSYYVEGINQLYQFDCGDQSGWMYKVNGWFPNYGASSYKLRDGDVMVWCYTCNGLGADVGDVYLG